MKITKDEVVLRIDELEKVLLEGLDLKNNLSIEELEQFYSSIIPYLMHNRNKEMLGRTPETLKINIDKYIDFCKKVGLTERDIIMSISKFPSILHTFNEEFVDKYVIMGETENEDNTLRKDKLVNNPRAFSIDFETVYARYSLMTEYNYPVNWNNLVKNTNDEFASIFVKGKYEKSYKVFENKSLLSVENLRRLYPVDYSVINDLRKKDINSNLFDGKFYGK